MNDNINNMDSTMAYKSRLYQDPKLQVDIGFQLFIPKGFCSKLLEKAKERYAKDKGFGIKRRLSNKIIKNIISENKDFLKQRKPTPFIDGRMAHG